MKTGLFVFSIVCLIISCSDTDNTDASKAGKEDVNVVLQEADSISKSGTDTVGRKDTVPGTEKKAGRKQSMKKRTGKNA